MLLLVPPQLSMLGGKGACEGEEAEDRERYLLPSIDICFQLVWSYADTTPQLRATSLDVLRLVLAKLSNGYRCDGDGGKCSCRRRRNGDIGTTIAAQQKKKKKPADNKEAHWRLHHYRAKKRAIKSHLIALLENLAAYLHHGTATVHMTAVLMEWCEREDLRLSSRDIDRLCLTVERGRAILQHELVQSRVAIPWLSLITSSFPRWILDKKTKERGALSGTVYERTLKCFALRWDAYAEHLPKALPAQWPAVLVPMVINFMLPHSREIPPAFHDVFSEENDE
jgi:hypothetical protein